jgi:hypothetical protein
MKIPSVKDLGKSPIQMIVLSAIVIFFVMPVSIPISVASLVDSPLGMILFFSAGVSLFVYGHPLVAVVFVLFAYEVIRRSSKRIGMHSNMIEFTPTERNREAEMVKMNPAKETTLEEEVISKMAPSVSNHGYVDTTFKPVSDDDHHASNV